MGSVGVVEHARTIAAACSPRRASGEATTATSARPGIVEQLFLDLLGAQVLATTDDHVGDAIGDREVAVVVEHADVAGVVPAVVVEHGCGELGIGVAEEEVGAAADDLAVVIEAQLHARHRAAVGVEALLPGCGRPAAGDRGVLRAAVRTEHDDAERVEALRHRRGDRRATEARVGHERTVFVGEVGVVEEAGEEEGRAAEHPHLFLSHDAQHLTRVPHVDEVDGFVTQQRHEEHADHPDEVADGRPGEPGRPGHGVHLCELAGLAEDGVVRVHHALRVTGGARGEPDQRRGVGVDRGGVRGGRVIERGVERARPRRELRRRVRGDEPAGVSGCAARNSSYIARWSV